MGEGCVAQKASFLDGFELFFHLVELFGDFVSEGIELFPNLFELFFEVLFEFKDFAFDD